MDNPELGRLVLKQVQAFPETFSMGGWGSRSACGTVACLAGHAMLLSGYELRGSVFYRPDGQRVTDETSEAVRLLGLSYAEYFDADGTVFRGFPLFHMNAAEAIARLEFLVSSAE